MSGELPEGSEPGEPEEIYLGDWPDLPHESVREGKTRKVEDTRARLAYFLVGLLAATFVLLFVLLYCEKLTPNEFSQVAGVTISPLIGLVGAVAGYYYGRHSRD